MPNSYGFRIHLTVNPNSVGGEYRDFAENPFS